MKLLKILENSRSTNSKLLSILIDPDKFDNIAFEKIDKSILSEIDIILLGGSLVSSNKTHTLINKIREQFDKPIFLFPGNVTQVVPQIDGVLFLSLISGRNPEYLIGQHIVAAPILRKMNIEVIPTAYLLIDGGKMSSASYISNTQPIPSDKNEIAVCTTMAGELLGLRVIFMDAGSGADKTISASMIQAVKSNTTIPIIVGGGIKSSSEAKAVLEGGADMIVIGNLLEENIIEFNSIIQVKKEINLKKTNQIKEAQTN